MLPQLTSSPSPLSTSTSVVRTRRLVSPVPSVVEDEAAASRTPSSLYIDAEGRSRRQSYDELLRSHERMEDALRRLATDHQTVSLEYAALLDRLRQAEETARQRDAAESAAADRKPFAKGDDARAALDSAAQMVQDMVLVIESLSASHQRLQLDVTEARSVNEILAKRVAELEVCGERLSLELEAMLQSRAVSVVTASGVLCGAATSSGAPRPSADGDSSRPPQLPTPPSTLSEFSSGPDLTEEYEWSSRLMMHLHSRRELYDRQFVEDAQLQRRAEELLRQGRGLRKLLRDRTPIS